MAYSFKRTVTIDETKCGSANSTDFPVLVSGTYAYLATVANGGKVQHASGHDVAFYADSELTTQLKHEIERWIATTGEVVYWVKVPTVSASTDTVIYLAYGDAGISATQADPPNVWDTSYKVVWHVGDGTTLSALDSTVNANNGTITGAVAGVGKVGGGMTVDGGDWINLADSSDWGHATLETEATLSVWANVNPTEATLRAIFRHVGIEGGAMYMLDSTANEFAAYTTGSFRNTTIVASQDVWYHVAYVQDDTPDALKVYVDGVLKYNSNGFQALGTAGIRLGADEFGQGFKGKLDEFRVSNSMRSADWVLTEYNNQNSPATFYTLGSEEGGDPPLGVLIGEPLVGSSLF